MKQKILFTMLVLLLVISAMSMIIPTSSFAASANSRISRIAKIAYRTGKINAEYGLDAPLEDFEFFTGHPRRIKIGYAVNRGIKKFWRDMYAGISENCPKLDDASKRFPIDNKDMFCYTLQLLRTFSEIDYILYEDGSFGIEGCIPSMGCTP